MLRWLPCCRSRKLTLKIPLQAWVWRAKSSAMTKYSFIVWNKHSRVRYPRSFELADVEAARELATRIARVFGEVVPRWNDLTYDRKNNFAVEVIDESGHTLLTVPFREAEEPKSH